MNARSKSVSVGSAALSATTQDNGTDWSKIDTQVQHEGRLLSKEILSKVDDLIEAS